VSVHGLRRVRPAALPHGAGAHRALRQGALHNRPVAAVCAAELAGDLRARDGELHESRLFERHFRGRKRTLRRPPGVNPHVLDCLLVLGTGPLRRARP
jgi:hypothetical protein